MSYLSGRGVPRDDAKAIEFLQKSADAGFPQAMVQLGTMYQYGQGTAKDEKKPGERTTRGSACARGRFHPENACRIQSRQRKPQTRKLTSPFWGRQRYPTNMPLQIPLRSL
jgi:Sel1 repeat